MDNMVNDADLFRQILALLNLATVVGMAIYYALKKEKR
jgi:uncharacterized membrane protein (Fun14 family)